MTIKEIEERTDMARSNIRFYENEGLLTPRRLSNGYRDYSESDVQLLLRIKLLRSLHISLDEIKALQDGSAALSATLIKKIEELEQEKKDVTLAQSFCRSIQDENVSFYNLDAAKYLDRLSQTADAQSSVYFAVEGDELPQVNRPWRRYFARIFDMLLYALIWWVFLAFVLHVNLANRTTVGEWLDACVGFVLMLFIEPLILHIFATTPGKAILGLRLESADGGRLSYGEGLARTWGVIGSGFGYNIPIYYLVRLWKSYKMCKAGDQLPWDESTSYTMKDTKWLRPLLLAAAYVALFAASFTVAYAQQLPPNRGELTVAEFAENYKYYANYYDFDLNGMYLDENGHWKKDASDSTVYIEVMPNVRPNYQFVTDNAYITGIEMFIEIEDGTNFITSFNYYDKYMILAAFALAGAQDEVGLFTRVNEQITKQISENYLKDFQFDEVGLSITCDVEHTGYIDHSPLALMPDDNAAETYFSLYYLISVT